MMSGAELAACEAALHAAAQAGDEIVLMIFDEVEGSYEILAIPSIMPIDDALTAHTEAYTHDGTATG